MALLRTTACLGVGLLAAACGGSVNETGSGDDGLDGSSTDGGAGSNGASTTGNTGAGNATSGSSTGGTSGGTSGGSTSGGSTSGGSTSGGSGGVTNGSSGGVTNGGSGGVNSGSSVGSSGGTFGSSSGGSFDAGPPPPDIRPRHAFAIYRRDLPPIDLGGSGSNSGGSTSGGSGAPEISPDTLYLKLGTWTASCEDPRATVQCGEWEVSIPLAPDQQVTGTLSLSDLNASSSASGQNADAPPGDCWWGGGSFFDGTITITEITSTSVAFMIDGTQTFDFAADGTYEAAICFAGSQ